MNTNTPKFSVVIPAYNQAQFLADAIHSVMFQTYRDFEIIVVDDGSTDNTPQVAQQFGEAIRYIRQTNQGLSAARNTAIRNARAEIIALLDSDDLWEPNFLEKMTNLLNMYPEASGSYCGFQYIDAQGHIVGKPSLKVVPPELFHQTVIYEGNWLVPSAIVFSKQLVEQVGLFDITINPVADADMWIRLSAIRPFIGLPEALVRYRQHDSNMSKDPEQMVTADYRLKEKMFGPPKGDPSSWPRMKQHVYAQLFRYGTSRYLAYGSVEKGANYFQQLIEISPNLALDMGVWRGLARAHLPSEYQFDPDAQLDWTLAQRDVMALLGELAKRSTASFSFQKRLPRIKASAFLALADEAVRASDLSQARVWLSRALVSSPFVLLSRPYWGTLARGAIRLGRSLIARFGDGQ